MKGSITWFEIKDGLFPVSDPTTKWDFGTYSNTVILLCRNSLSFSRYGYLPDGTPTGWQGYNLPDAPTHWAYVNYPETEPIQ